MHVSVAEALTALVSKYLDCVLAAQQEEVEQFFSNLIGRARVREAINALQAARELSFVHVGGRVMLQVSSLQAPPPLRECKPKPSRSSSRFHRDPASRWCSGGRETASGIRKPELHPAQDAGKE